MIPTDITIFGATGDLAQHKLLPTLLRLCADGRLPEGARIRAIGRRPYDTAQFLEVVRPHLEAQGLPDGAMQGFASILEYVQLNFDEPATYDQLVPSEPRNVLFYLAVAPESFEPVLQNIRSHGLSQEREGAWVRVMIEKPFGSDQASSLDLNELLATCFEERQIYRIDHYAGKETVQNVLAFRFANRLLESQWNGASVDHIQISISEEAGIGTRGGYYDHAGTTRDMLQSHLLQLLSVVSMDEPESFGQEHVARRQRELLRTVRVVAEEAVFGQYDGYLQEEKVTADSQTETYVMATAYLDGGRWQGTPVYLRSGRRMPARVADIHVQFKPAASGLLSTGGKPTVVSFRLQPNEGIAVRFQAKVPGRNRETVSQDLTFHYKDGFPGELPDAYERLFTDAMAGDFSLALHPATILEEWRIADEILAAKAAAPLHRYPAGSWGPPEAEAILERAGRHWLTQSEN